MRPTRADPALVIDSPRANARGARFDVQGWTLDPLAITGSGVSAVHVWAYPLSGDAPFFLGAADMGVARPDVVAIYGRPAERAGYGLRAEIATPGDYMIAVFPFVDTTCGAFGPGETVLVTVPR